MPQTFLDIRVRTIECPNCRAPVQTPRAGGHVECEYCGTALEVSARRPEGDKRDRAESAAEEIARLARLRGQEANPLRGHRYDLFRYPPGLESLKEMSWGQRLEVLKQEWTKLAGGAGVGVGEADAFRLLWVALSLARAYSEVRDDHLRSRAVLETSLDLLPDAGDRHFVRCRLAIKAAFLGELEAAEGWLAECDPASEVLEIDSEYRNAKARIVGKRRDHREVLRLLGEKPGDLPISAHAALGAALMRIDAHEALGAGAVAIQQARLAARRWGKALVEHGLRKGDFAPQTAAALASGAVPAEKGQRRVGVVMATVVLPLLIIGGAVVWLVRGTPGSPPPHPADQPGASVSVQVGDVAQQLHQQCESGNPGPCVALGALYSKGQGVPVDPKKARSYYEKACKLGLSTGCLLRDNPPASPAGSR